MEFNRVVRRRVENLPTYVTETETVDGLPHIVTTRVVAGPNPQPEFEDLLNSIAPTIQSRIIEAIQEYNLWTRERILERCAGRLLATNLDNGSGKAFSQYFHSIGEITIENILEIFSQIQQSNGVLLITDLDWTFTIVASTIAIGGAPQKVKVPLWHTTTDYLETWKAHEGVNCAALSICYSIYQTKRKYKQFPARAIEDAKKLQEELGWSQFVPLESLGDFVKSYPDYRLSVILPVAEKTPYTFEGADFVFEQPENRHKPKNIVYLVYDSFQKHFGATNSPAKVASANQKGQRLWCHKCITCYGPHQEHICFDGSWKKEKFDTKKAPCHKCGVIGKHTCPLYNCYDCGVTYAKSFGNYVPRHRCIIKIKERKEDRNTFNETSVMDGKLFCLWVYDFESRLVIEESTRELVSGFRMDGQVYLQNTNLGDAKDTPTGQDVRIFSKTVQKHKVNFVALRNVFTNEEYTFSDYDDGDALAEFILFITQINKGKNICIAHNASGYDARLLFSKANELKQKPNMKAIMRGGKFVQIKLNAQTIFRDSLLHVKGSLKALAKDFCNGLLEKGYFPHLFNSVENYDYCGPIPDKKYFDLSFSARTSKDVEEFNSWYSTWQGRNDWNFKNQLELYCKNDVLVLREIVKGYHDVAFEKFKMSPWFNSTAPSFVHEMFLVKLTAALELPDPKEEVSLYKERIAQLADKEHWAVLNPSEYDFARKALRGGRTDIRKIYHKVSNDEWDRGVRIRYQDICSQYPYQQVEHDFPVGTPLVHVWDAAFNPCVRHRGDSVGECTQHSECFIDKDVKYSFQPVQWSVQEILAKTDFFGIVCATVIPPKMYHPVLVAFDKKLNKSVASCEKIVKGVFTSIEFVTALKNGYKLLVIHRYDQYARKPSLWRDIILDLFLEKMKNSKNQPPTAEAQKLIVDYGDLFGEEFADKIYDSMQAGEWKKNPAKKQTAKIMMNSAWGKHAQKAVMDEVVIFNGKEDRKKFDDFFANLVSQNYLHKNSTYLAEDTFMYTFSVSGPNTLPDLHGGYLPAALFVPAYGRLQLWNQLNKLGKRVLMNDTDSIVYIYDPDEYNIPEGSLLGQWEVEDEDSQNGGIVEFVGVGPKTYGFKCFNGYEKVKTKGISLNLATSRMINFESMKKMVLLRNEKEVHKSLMIPQRNFAWTATLGMRNWYMLKEFKFSREELKGDLDENGHLYPFGYNKN
jgi:hypothetical protein